MKDYINSIVMLLLSIFVYASSASFADVGAGIIGDPAFYPRVLAVILGAMSIALLIGTLRKKEKLKFVFNREVVINVVKLFGLITLYMIALQFVGFIPSTIVFTILCINLYGGSWKMGLIACVPTTLIIYVLFTQLLSLRLPVGSLFT